MTKPTHEPAAGRERPLAAVPADEPLYADGTVSVDETWLGKIAATDALFVTDDRQRLRAWSNAAQRMLGYSSDDVVGRLCYDVVMGSRPDGHPVCGTSCPVTRNARRGRGTASYPILAVAKDGSQRYLDNTVLVLEQPRGSFRVVHLLRESCETPPARPVATTPAFGDSPLAEQLTRRELEVLRAFAQGVTLEEVASELSISVFTARNHATNIEHKLGVRNRLQMVLEGMRRGLV
jgi:PAS domain S-box-containing protein